jgi:hypothetical protein
MMPSGGQKSTQFLQPLGIRDWESGTHGDGCRAWLAKLASAGWQASASLRPTARVESETQTDFIRPDLLQLPGITLINHAEPTA